MAHTPRSMIEVLESMDTRLAALEISQAAVEQAVQDNTAAVQSQAADIAAMKVEAEVANDLARYMASHTYGVDPLLP